MSFWISKSREKRSKKLARPNTSGQAKERISIRALLLALLIWSSAVFLIYIGGPAANATLAPGQKAPDTVVAAVDFTCVDVALTDLNRRQAADTVPPVFTINNAPLNTALRSLDKLFGRVGALKRSDDMAEATRLEQEVGDVLDLLGLPLSPEQALSIVPEDGEDKELVELMEGVLRAIWSRGIVSESQKGSLFSHVSGGGAISVELAVGKATVVRETDQLVTPEQAVQEALKRVAEQRDVDRPTSVALESLFTAWLTPNLNYDSGATDDRREKAIRSVEPKHMFVRAGTTLVERGERVSDQVLVQLQAHNKRLSQLESPYDTFFTLLGRSGLLLISLVLCSGLLQMVRPRLMKVDAHILVLFILSLMALLACKGLAYLSTSTRLVPYAYLDFLTPLGLAPLLAAILLGGGASIALGIWISLAVSIMYGNSFPILVMGMAITIIATHTARDVRRRSTIFRAGLWIGLTKLLCAISLGALYQQTASTLALQAAASFTSAFFSAFMVMLLVPVFEYIFKITTNITLLELSDMGHPVLQRLAIEAPGTYNHSLMVANLAQAATTEIGGNALLARVCAYYHDIGKLTKPEFFSENTQYRDNPHDELAPSMSTLVIISHVKEGVGLARRSRLPQTIIDGIEQHHGTGLITYFYHRAKKQYEAELESGAKVDGRKVNEEDFRYPGPKPQTKEMGILLLSDATEATSRSMEKPTPNRIESMVHEIVDTRLHDGQLDECDLTFSELTTIKRSLVFTLTNMLHGRIAYPKNEDNDKQQANKATATHGADQTVQQVAHGASAAG